MRGKVHLVGDDPADGGITPAHAGKSTFPARATSARRDHPRACGEKAPQPDGERQQAGSPPRMRGKALALPLFPLDIGITPAHAGKRHSRCATSPATRDHPRACGDKSITPAWIMTPLGSPPRMRGKGVFSYPTNCLLGITPAHAGKRQKRSRSTVPPAAIVLRFSSVCNRPAGSIGNPAERGAPPFPPAENAAPALPA